jgi:hypothetical protein
VAGDSDRGRNGKSIERSVEKTVRKCAKILETTSFLYWENRKVGQMNHYKNDFLNPIEEPMLIDLKACEMKGISTRQGEAMAVTWRRGKTDKEEELLVRFELPIIVAAWVILLITFGYLIYVGV